MIHSVWDSKVDVHPLLKFHVLLPVGCGCHAEALLLVLHAPARYQIAEGGMGNHALGLGKALEGLAAAVPDNQAVGISEGDFIVVNSHLALVEKRDEGRDLFREEVVMYLEETLLLREGPEVARRNGLIPALHVETAKVYDERVRGGPV